MVFPGSSQITNQGVLHFVNNSYNSLQFTFDLSLKGGQYQCKQLDDYVVDLNPGKENSFLELCFIDRNIERRWVANFEILFMRDGDYNSSYFFGGNDEGAQYGYHQIAQWNSQTYQRYIVETVYWTNFTLPIQVLFNQVCIFNACGTSKIYCPNYSNFTGSFVVRDYTTTTPVEANSVNSSCTVSQTVIVANPTHSPTTKPTTEFPTARPSKHPSSRPSRKPSAHPSAKPTAIPSRRPSAKPTAVPSAKPTANPTIIPSVKPTAIPSAKPTANPTAIPSAKPTAIPSEKPTAIPSANPTT